MHNCYFSDYVSDEVKDTRIKKRFANKDLKKRLLTVEIFTMMDYSIYRKWVICLIKQQIDLIVETFCKSTKRCLRFFEESKATTDKEKSKDAVKTIIFIFTHIMEKVCGWISLRQQVPINSYSHF